MNKYLRPKYLPLMIPALALLGLLLRLWTLGGGPDKSGLYAPAPFPWTLLWLVTALTAGLVILLILPLKYPGKYATNFPASIPAAVGTGLAALAIMLAGVKLFSAGDGLSIFTGLLGVAAAMALVVVAFARYRGQRPSFLLYAAVCLFLALRIFILCRSWSNETQIGAFIMPFLASIAIMLAAYQQASFAVDLGDRRHCLFWSLMGAYFCIVALPGSGDSLFYICMALWLLTNLCSLRRLKPKAPTPEQEA